MRIGELSRRTGVPVPTVKYYLREGLLPSGELTSPNQAHYGEAHERRLRLIRALIEVGGLPVAAVREVLEAVTEPDLPVHALLGTVQKGITRAYGQEADPAHEAARRAVEALVARRGWQVSTDGPAVRALVEALARLRELGHGAFEEMLDDYAEACERIAAADLAYVRRSTDLEGLVEGVVVGTVLGDAVLVALRRLAHKDASARLFRPDGVTDGGGDGPEDGRAGGAVGGPPGAAVASDGRP
ncbi:MerR family transcriptional regulator [Streptomyces sp. NPDC059637]|uniref:MerR family transcriptional regulator n=1 Tax=Streptomyces sp. NPDC059637 TaxID=3347752 RepID=UPI003699EABE